MAGDVGPGLPGGHVGSRGMAGAVDLGMPDGHVCSRGMAGAVVTGVPGGHVGSWVMPGAVGPGMLPAILLPKLWSDLWAWDCPAAMLVLGAW